MRFAGWKPSPLGLAQLLGVQLGDDVVGTDWQSALSSGLESVVLAELPRFHFAQTLCGLHQFWGQLSGPATLGGAVTVGRWRHIALWLRECNGRTWGADVHFQFLTKYPNSWRGLDAYADFVFSYRDDSQYDVIT